MEYLRATISKSAKKFIRANNIQDVTFNLLENEVAGCCVGIVKEIQQVYQAPKDASGYHHCEVEGCHIFISRKINIIGPLTLSTEGIWKKQLFLQGANVPI